MPTTTMLFNDLGDLRVNTPTDDLCRNLWVSQFLGVVVIQQWADLLLWERLFNRRRDLKSCVELGSLYGGLSLFLYLQCLQRNILFDTFDLEIPQAVLTPLGQRLHLEDCCHAGDLWAMQSTFNNIFKRDGALLFFCDNGDKPREMREFVPRLRVGDIVGVHDFGLEFFDTDLEGYRHLLRPLMHTDAEALGAVTRFWERV